MDGRHENYEKKKRTRKEYNNNTHTHLHTHTFSGHLHIHTFSYELYKGKTILDFNLTNVGVCTNVLRFAGTD